MRMHTRSLAFGSTGRAIVASVLGAAALVGAGSGLGYESGTRPLPGVFEGHFTGAGSGNIAFYVLPAAGSESPRVGVRAVVGFVPGDCVKAGRTRVAARDGGGILFNTNHYLRIRPRTTEIPPNGAFAFRLVLADQGGQDWSYSVVVRGTFGRTTVSGRVQGTGTDPLTGKCRAYRMFRARRTGP